MNDQEFEQFEKRMLEKILAGGDEVLEILREQYKGAVVTERWFSGVGFFSTFQVNEKTPKLSNHCSIQLTDFHARCDELAHGMGFVLFIRDGIIATLEGFTFDEKWPEHLTNLRLCYLPENPADTRDMEDLRRKFLIGNKSYFDNC